MADNEKMFNTYPVAEAINDDDLGMLWDITTDSCKNFNSLKSGWFYYVKNQPKN